MSRGGGEPPFLPNPLNRRENRPLPTDGPFIQLTDFGLFDWMPFNFP
jgi:hypothetical protein